MAPVDPAPWPPRWITQRRRDLFCTCLLLKQVEKSVSQGLDVDALDVQVLLSSNRIPKTYIERQTESESITSMSSIEKNSNNVAGIPRP